MPTSGLTLAYNYLEAIDLASGERLLRVPHNQLTLIADHEIRSCKLALSGRWTDARPDISGFDPVTWAPIVISLPGHAIFDLLIEKSGSGTVHPYVNLRNLTNEAYQEVAGYPAEGRSIETGIRANW